MPYRQKNSKYWTIRVPDGRGGKARRSSGTTDYTEAKALESKLNAEEYNRVTWGQEPTRYFDTLMELYLSETEQQRNYERNLYATRRLAEFFTGQALNDMPPGKINEYKRSCNVSDATIRKELILFSTAINYARREWGWKIDNPVTGRLPPKPKGRLRWLTHEQADKLLKAASDMDRSRYLHPLIKLALNTGMRRGELLGLEWHRVDFINRLIYLEPEHQKSGERGAVPLNGGALSALRARRGEHERWVFDYRGKRIANIKTAFRTACDAAGIENFTFHDLRHTFASWAVQDGLPLKTVGEILRHKDPSTTDIYAHLAPDNLRDAIDRMSYDDNMTGGSELLLISDSS